MSNFKDIPCVPEMAARAWQSVTVMFANGAPTADEQCVSRLSYIAQSLQSKNPHVVKATLLNLRKLMSDDQEAMLDRQFGNDDRTLFRSVEAIRNGLHPSGTANRELAASLIDQNADARQYNPCPRLADLIEDVLNINVIRGNLTGRYDPKVFEVIVYPLPLDFLSKNYRNGDRGRLDEIHAFVASTPRGNQGQNVDFVALSAPLDEDAPVRRAFLKVGVLRAAQDFDPNGQLEEARR